MKTFTQLDILLRHKKWNIGIFQESSSSTIDSKDSNAISMRTSKETQFIYKRTSYFKRVNINKLFQQQIFEA